MRLSNYYFNQRINSVTVLMVQPDILTSWCATIWTTHHLWNILDSERHSVVSDSLRLNGQHSPWNAPDQNTRVGSLSLLQWIFPTQGSNPGLLHYRQSLYQLSHKANSRILEWVAYPFSSRSSPSRNRTRLSCTAAGFFTKWAICV